MNKDPRSHTTVRPHSRILDADKARMLAAEGWAAADLHVHTFHSHDVIPTPSVHPLTLYRKARRLGMTYVAFTDHDSMDAYDQIGWTREGLVPAVEIKILDPKNVGHTVHINVYTLDRRQFHEISKIAREARDIERLTAYLNGEGLPFVFNHPFWHEAGEEPNLQSILDIADLFPVLEYNMGRVGRLNGQALRLAQARRKGIVASTDTHIGDIGRAFSLARGRTFQEFFELIERRQSFIVPADLTLSRLKEETSIRIRHLFCKDGWMFPKESFTLDTGHAILDRMARRLAQAPRGSPRLRDKILKLALEAVSHSRIPGSLYLRSQRFLADRISGLLENLEEAI